MRTVKVELEPTIRNCDMINGMSDSASIVPGEECSSCAFGRTPSGGGVGEPCQSCVFRSSNGDGGAVFRWEKRSCTICVNTSNGICTRLSCNLYSHFELSPSYLKGKRDHIAQSLARAQEIYQEQNKPKHCRKCEYVLWKAKEGAPCRSCKNHNNYLETDGAECMDCKYRDKAENSYPCACCTRGDWYRNDKFEQRIVET